MKNTKNYSQSVTELVNWLASESIGGGCGIELVYESSFSVTAVSKALDTYGLVAFVFNDLRIVPLPKGTVYLFTYYGKNSDATVEHRQNRLDVLHPEIDSDAAYQSMRYLGYYEDTYTLVSLSCPLPGKVRLG
jgi:hypothetical protein